MILLPQASIPTHLPTSKTASKTKDGWGTRGRGYSSYFLSPSTDNSMNQVGGKMPRESLQRFGFLQKSMINISFGSGIMIKKGEFLIFPVPLEEQRQLERDDKQRVWDALQVSNLYFYLGCSRWVSFPQLKWTSWMVTGLQSFGQYNHKKCQC